MVGPIGELTEVASAKRAVRGVLMESPNEELDDLRDRTVIRVSFSVSKLGFVRGRSVSTGETGS